MSAKGHSKVASWALRVRTGVMTLLAVLALAVPLHAVEPDEILTDARLEARARALSAELRCLVCQNQSIDDSNAPLARDLRLLVRERVRSGDSDRQVIQFVVARYGEFVLLRPRLGWHTLVLWLAPAALLVLAGSYLLLGWRRRAAARAAAVSPPLSDAEKNRLFDLLKQPGSGP